jgi:putative ABC transport system permease protein
MTRYFPLVRAALRRRRARTVLTVGSVFIAFLLFTLLMSVRHAFLGGIPESAKRVLITANATSLVSPLPLADRTIIASVPGVKRVAYEVWFGGYYRQTGNFVFALAVDPRTFLDELKGDLGLSRAARARWIADRRGAIVGRALARRFAWHVGEVIPLRSNVWRRKNGTNVWPLRVDAIVRSRSSRYAQLLLLHYHYLSETAVAGVHGYVSLYRVVIAHARDAAALARAIDARFANSPDPTRTTTARTFLLNFLGQFADIGTIVTAVLAAVFFTMLLVTANTMARSVRERTREFAVLRTLGYTPRHLLGLVVGEAALLVGVGAALGLVLGLGLVSALHTALAAFLPALAFPPSALVLGAALAAFFALVSSLVPYLQIARLGIADALRRE